MEFNFRDRLSATKSEVGMTGMNKVRYAARITQAISHVGRRPIACHFDGLVHRALIAVDIAGFGDQSRDDEIQLHVRESLYAILKESFMTSGIRWRRCHREDRGDGVLIIVPPHVPTSVLFDSVADRLVEGLRKHNRMTSEAARIELRMAIHLGHVRFDDWGVTGHAVVRLFRLLEAPDFKQRFVTSGAEFGLIISDDLYRDLLRQRAGLVEPAAYQRVTVTLKETQAVVARAYIPAARIGSSAGVPLAVSTEDDGLMRLA